MRQVYRKNARISDYFTGGVMELKETLLQPYVGTQTWLAFYLCLSADIIVSHYFGALFCISNINKLQINTLSLHERNKMEFRLESHCLSDFEKDLIIEDRIIVLMKIRIYGNWQKTSFRKLLFFTSYHVSIETEKWMTLQHGVCMQVSSVWSTF